VPLYFFKDSLGADYQNFFSDILMGNCPLKGRERFLSFYFFVKEGFG
jgi:hypothetical protein